MFQCGCQFLFQTLFLLFPMSPVFSFSVPHFTNSPSRHQAYSCFKKFKAKQKHYHSEFNTLAPLFRSRKAMKSVLLESLWCWSVYNLQFADVQHQLGVPHTDMVYPKSDTRHTFPAILPPSCWEKQLSGPKIVLKGLHVAAVSGKLSAELENRVQTWWRPCKALWEGWQLNTLLGISNELRTETSIQICSHASCIRTENKKSFQELPRNILNKGSVFLVIHQV